MKKVKQTKQAAPTPLRLPDDLRALLEKQMKEENRKLGNMIITILKEYYNNKKV